jgi:glutamyl-tRNA reductase
VSVSSAAVDLARKMMGNLEGKTVMVIGAGQMAELAAKHLIADGIGTIFVSNRNFDRAKDLGTTI